MIERYPDAVVLAQAAADRFIALAGEAVRARGRFTAVLSGGATPCLMHEELAMPDRAVLVDWPHVHLFWGDERCVPPDNPESNYRMAEESLLSRVPIPPENIYRIRGELPPEQAAVNYEQQLRAFFAEDPLPRFDLVMLGLGDDGHTASLFPGTAALVETDRWVVANYVPKLDAWRITLTVPVINLAQEVIFLVEGTRKAEAVRDVLTGPLDAKRLPAQLIHPTSGHLIWMLDAGSAGILPAS